MTANRLPVIDLASSFGSDAVATLELAREIDAACRRHGFFYVIGHGVPLALTSHLFMLSRRFFALPEDVKRRWHIDRSGGLHRGFDPVGWQALDPTRPPDLKESFYLGVDRDHTDALVRAGTPQHGPNQWPDEDLVPGFQSTCEVYAATMQRVSRQLMGLMALGLRLPRDHFEPSMRNPMPVLRLLHYPGPRSGAGAPAAPPAEPVPPLPGQLGCGAHTDWGGLTLLAQDSAGGLQVHDRTGEWIDVPPMEGSLVVNLGDMMQRWTNDHYRSTLHRVHQGEVRRERHSLAYFFDIDYHAQVSALAGCWSAEDPPHYPPITAGEHIVEMYRRTTSAPADPATLRLAA